MYPGVSLVTRVADAGVEIAVVVLASVLCSQGCVRREHADASSPVVVRLANPSGGTLAPELAAEYDRSTSRFKVQSIEIGGAHNLETVLRGEADVTASGADSVYSAYQSALQNRSPTGHQLRAIAALPVTPLHLLVRDDSPIRGLADLRGATLGGYRMPLLNLLFEPGGLDAPAAWRYTTSLAEAAGLVSDRLADAAFVIAYYPNPTVRAALQRGAHLIPFEGAAVEQVRRRHRLIKQVTIPGNVYPGHPTPIHTIGVDLVIVCRSDLAEPVVYDFTKHLFDALPGLAKRYSSLRVYDVDQAPATPIPLHEGAARYYREVELSR